MVSESAASGSHSATASAKTAAPKGAVTTAAATQPGYRQPQERRYEIAGHEGGAGDARQEGGARSGSAQDLRRAAEDFQVRRPGVGRKIVQDRAGRTHARGVCRQVEEQEHGKHHQGRQEAGSSDQGRDRAHDDSRADEDQQVRRLLPVGNQRVFQNLSHHLTNVGRRH